MQFGAILRKMRKKAGLSQEELAEELHIARSSISKLERDRLELRAADLIKWAESTNATDMLIALIIGADVTVVQQVIELVSSSVATIINIF